MAVHRPDHALVWEFSFDDRCMPIHLLDKILIALQNAGSTDGIGTVYDSRSGGNGGPEEFSYEVKVAAHARVTFWAELHLQSSLHSHAHEIIQIADNAILIC